MSLRPPPRPRPAPPETGVDALAAFDLAVKAAETILAEALPRLDRLARDAEQTRQDLEALLTTLRETAEDLRNPDGVRSPTPEVMDIEEAEPLVTPPPRKSAPPGVRKVVPPPVPPEALGETTDMGPRKTSPLEETSEMPQVPPREEWPAAKPPAKEEEAIRFHCEKCGTKLSAPAKYVGKAASCKCGHRSTIPPKSTRERGGK
ncbi:MAG: hypothetical protein AAB074_07070 [Planctomycetota bacterium]